MQRQLLRNVSERLQIVHPLGDADQVVIIELVVGVDELEHPLQQLAEEAVHHLGQILVFALVVASQIVEELSEDLRVLLVE